MGCTQRIGFSVISPITGAEVQLQCAQTILPSTTAAVQLGDFCDPATGNTTTMTPTSCSMGRAVAGNPTPLACDPFARACEVHCSTDADCTGAGLLSYVCDTRTAVEVYGSASMVPSGVVPAGMDPNTFTHNFCVNPTCGVSAQ
jgi:hypothetical protein